MTEVVSQLLKINLRMRIDSICYAVDDMDQTQAQLQTHGIEFSRLTEFHGNKVAFVHPRDACGIALEFIQGPLVEKAGS